MEMHILKFPEDGLIRLQLFMEGISFPVAVAAYSEQDIGKISHLIRLVQRREIHSTYALCLWCTRQRVAYQILFRISVHEVLHNPVRIYDYLRLQRLVRKAENRSMKN